MSKKRLPLALVLLGLLLQNNKELTEEHKRRISEALIGNKNPFYGKTHTQETKRKLSGNGKKLIEEFNPDFINEELKKIIEFDKLYWYSLPNVKIKDEKRNLAYLENGYDVLILNEYSLENTDELLTSVGSFLEDV